MKKSYPAFCSKLYRHIPSKFNFTPSYPFLPPLRLILKGTMFLSLQFHSFSFASNLDQSCYVKPQG